MNIIYSREEVIFLVFSHLNVYYTPHFHFSVVNYSLGCKEVYIIVIFFFPRSWWPKEMHCQTISRFLWTPLLARRKRLVCGCLQLFPDKRLLVVSQARFASGIWCQSQNRRGGEVIPPSTLQPASQERIHSVP